MTAVEVLTSFDEVRRYRIAEAVRTIVTELGYDLDDQHFLLTPERVAKVLTAFSATNADSATPADILAAVFDDEHDALVQVGPIKVVSMCAHHMLPVTGWAWVGYIPDGKVCGISKLARITHYFAHQYTVQERVTQQIANALMDNLDPKGCMVVISATHGCMSVRGVEEPEAVTRTSAIRGVFRTEPDARTEFLALMGMR